MPKDSTQFLKERVSQQEIRKQQQTPKTTSVVESSTTFLEDVTSDEKTASVMQNKLHKRAQAADAADLEKDTRQQQKEEQEQLKEQERQRQEQSQDIRDRISRTATVTSERITPAIDRVGALPTVGGIGLLVAILIVILFTVVRVNPQGDTRMKQLWYMLNGRATIQGRQTIQKGSSATAANQAAAAAVGGLFPSSVSQAPSALVPTSSTFRDTSNLGF